MVRSLLILLFCGAVLPSIIRAQQSDTLINADIVTEEETRNVFFDAPLNSAQENILLEQTQLLLDYLDQLLQFPISLDLINRNELLEIPTLSPLDQQRILKTRKTANHLNNLSLHSLMRRTIFQTNKPYLSYLPRSTRNRIAFRTRVFFDPNALNDPEYLNHSYKGSPIKTSSSINTNTSDISFSLVQSKSAGEPLYFDHLVGPLSTRTAIPITKDIVVNKLCLGDYSLSYGNGLLFSHGLAQYPSKQTLINPMLPADGFRAYNSTSSSKYFRGAAVEVQDNGLRIAGFFSDRKFDAQVDSGTITYAPQTGLHRTSLEISRQNTSRQTVFGGNISFTATDSAEQALTVMLTAFKTRFDLPINTTDSNSFHFRGKEHSMASLSLSTTIEPVSVNAEYARTFSDWHNTGAFAITSLFEPFPSLRITVNYHNLPAQFYSPFGNTLGLYTNDAQNERGFYGGILFGPTNDLAIYGYFANAQNSMYPNELSQIISTTRVTLGLSYALDNILLSGDFRYTKKLQLNSDSLSSSRYEFPLKVRKYFSQYFNVTLEGQYLIETNSSATEYGRLLRLATCYTPSVNLKVKLSATFYHTDSFISRFYQSDVDLPGNSSLFQFFGSGSHYSVVILYNITGGISVAASLAQSVYAYPIGTDLTHKMLVGFQCDARF